MVRICPESNFPLFFSNQSQDNQTKNHKPKPRRCREKQTLVQQHPHQSISHRQRRPLNQVEARVHEDGEEGGGEGEEECENESIFDTPNVISLISSIFNKTDQSTQDEGLGEHQPSEGQIHKYSHPVVGGEGFKYSPAKFENRFFVCFSTF